MDSLPKILRHVLFATAVCNIFLILAAIRVAFLPFILSLLLLGQTFSVLMMMHHRTWSFVPASFNPTEFMVGACWGVTVGGVVVALSLSGIYSYIPSSCEGQVDVMHRYSCDQLVRSSRSVWRWSTLVFWLNIASSALLAIGRHELSYYAEQQYESIGGSDDQFQQAQQQPPPQAQPPQQQQASQQSSQPFTIGNYSNIP